MAGSSSYCTSIRSSAAVAISSVMAATAATGSPMNRAVSGARACSSWLTGRIPNGMGRSSPVSTAFTPSSASALEVSSETIRPCGTVLRSSLAYSMRGSCTSSAKIVRPVTFATASTLRWGVPTMRSGCWAGSSRFGAPVGAVVVMPPEGALRVPMNGLVRGVGVLPAHACRRQLHRFVDLEVAGTATQVAGQGLLDLVARGLGVLFD